MCLQAHTLYVLHALAFESHLQLGRKMCYGLLSPWQYGMMVACLYPVVPDVNFLMKYIVGDKPVSSLPPLKDAAVLVSFHKLQLGHGEQRTAAEAPDA